MIDGKNVTGQPINGELKTYENIRKIAFAKEDDYTTGFCQIILILKKIIR